MKNSSSQSRINAGMFQKNSAKKKNNENDSALRIQTPPENRTIDGLFHPIPRS